MKRIVTLTESDLRHMIMEAIDHMSEFDDEDDDINLGLLPGQKPYPKPEMPTEPIAEGCPKPGIPGYNLVKKVHKIYDVEHCPTPYIFVFDRNINMFDETTGATSLVGAYKNSKDVEQQIANDFNMNPSSLYGWNDTPYVVYSGYIDQDYHNPEFDTITLYMS